MKTDYVHRPDVYYDGQCIFEYDKSGFNETVYWDVEWLSEDEILLYISSPDADNKYAEERYEIEMP